MSTKKKFKSDAFESIHSSASALLKVGAIEKATMREFDKACLAEPPKFGPVDIKKIRESQGVSQPIFARYLNTSESTVEKLEAGAKNSMEWRSNSSPSCGNMNSNSWPDPPISVNAHPPPFIAI